MNANRPCWIAQLLDYFKTTWGLFRFSHPEEHAVQLRREQASILSHTIWLFSTLGIGCCSFFTFGLEGTADFAVRTLYLIIVTLYFSLIGAVINRLYRDDDVLFIRISVCLLFLLGLCWGGLVNLLAVRHFAAHQGAILELVMGLVSAPMLGVPISAALAFFIPVSVICSITVAQFSQSIEIVAKLSFLGFITFAFIGVIYINKVILERSISRLNLERQHETLRVFLREYEEVSSDWLWETDASGRLRNISPRMKQLFGRDSRFIEGARFSELGLRGENENGKDLDSTIARNTAFRDLIMVLNDGKKRLYLNFTGHPVHDRNGFFLGFRGVGSDITEKKKAEARIQFLATHDDLTGVTSRSTFLEALRKACGQAKPFALLLVDIDRFKSINDKYGHVIGNVMLQKISDRMRAIVHPHHLIGRLGGDEFTILLENLDQDAAVTLSHHIVAELNRDLHIGKITITPSISIGIAASPTQGNAPDLLFRRADLALYAAKKKRNSSCLFNEQMEVAYFERVKLKADLDNAIKRREFFLEFQPILDTSSYRLVSAEALIRWRHPRYGILNAERFIKTVESADLIEEIGAFVINTACQEAATWPDNLPIAVNVSAKQLVSRTLVNRIKSCLENTGLAPERLVLEMTESSFLAAVPETTEELQAIRALGVKLVLDDFGTGYSSLTYLCRFDVDGIKIDASFIKSVTTSQKVTAIVRTIARLACDMNVFVVAEGVETRDQLAWLQRNGIAFAQGFFLGYPQSSRQIQRLAQKRVKKIEDLF